MKKLLVAALFVSAFGSGCAYVTSALPGGNNTVDGGAWYTKSKFFLIFPTGTDIYYCEPGGKKCMEAEIQ